MCTQGTKTALESQGYVFKSGDIDEWMIYWNTTNVNMYEDWYKDLSEPAYQGSFGHDQIDKLTKPGYYRLPFKFYESNGNTSIKNIVVRVSAIFSGEKGPGQCIVVENDYMYVFYYNGAEKCFKPNFEESSLDEIYEMMDQLANWDSD